MRFQVVHTLPNVSDSTAEFLLKSDDWNDYGHKTQYRLYCREPDRFMSIGNVKIAANEQLPVTFDRLDPSACSLGQSVSYYTQLQERFPSRVQSILRDLRDVHLDASYLQDAERPIIRNALLRFPTAQRLSSTRFTEGHNVPKKFELNFDTRLTGFDEDHEIRLAFDADCPIPCTIAVLIGESGTGKTGILTKLSYSLGGDPRAAVKLVSPSPLFHRLLVMAYGVMQPFREHLIDPATYVYCGSQNIGTFASTEAVRHFASIVKNIPEGYQREWREFWDELLRKIGKTPEGGDAAMATVFGTLSAGHRMYATIVADLIAKLVPGTLLLFDEPETHLHPALLNSLLARLQRLLLERNSFAILATHAPLVVQSVLAHQVRILERDGSRPIVGEPDRETFGSGMSELMQTTFGMGGLERSHHESLARASKVVAETELRALFKSPITLPLDLLVRSGYVNRND